MTDLQGRPGAHRTVDDAAAHMFAEHLADSAAWLHRRTEVVTFHDDAVVARAVTVEVSIDGGLPYLRGLVCVPLALLPKAPIAGLGVVDEERRAVPTLTAAEQTAVVGDAVVSWGGALLGVPLPGSVAADIAAVVAVARGGPVRLRQLWAAADHAEVRRGLREAAEGKVAALLGALASGFVVVAGLLPGPARRRVLTVTADERIVPAPASRADRIATAWGWRPRRIIVPVSGALAGRSAHLEVAVPPGVDVEEAVAHRGGTVLATASDAPHVHLHLGLLALDDHVEVEVGFRPERHGWLAQSAWAATGVAAALVLSGWRLGTVAGSNASAEAASLLLGLTGLAATLLVRPREHRLATWLLAGLRRLAALPPVGAAAAAGLLVVGPSRPLLDAVWWLLAGGCATVAVVLQTARLRPGGRGRAPPRWRPGGGR